MKNLFLIMLFTWSCHGMQEGDRVVNVVASRHSVYATDYEIFSAVGDLTPSENADKVRIILENGILSASDLSQPDEFGNTLLQYLVRLNDLLAMSLILKYGVDPDVVSGNVNALLIACENNNSEAIMMLIKAGAHPRGVNGYGPLECLDFSKKVLPLALTMLLDAGAHAPAPHEFLKNLMVTDGCISSGIKNKIRLLGMAGSEVTQTPRHIVKQIYANFPLIQALLSGRKSRFTSILSHYTVTQEYCLEYMEALMLAYGHGLFEEAHQLYIVLKEFTCHRTELLKTLRMVLKRGVSNGKVRIVETVLVLPEIDTCQDRAEYLGELLEIALMHDYADIVELLMRSRPNLSMSKNYCMKASTPNSSAIKYFLDNYERVNTDAEHCSIGLDVSGGMQR